VQIEGLARCPARRGWLAPAHPLAADQPVTRLGSPQSFTFGGVIAHVITYSAYHREVLIRSLAELGVHDIDAGDPTEWERLRQADRPRPAE
jgi:hypothetical protein